SDGADQTLTARYGADAVRDGEPFGELGLVLQQDAAWGDQHGSARDPQPGTSQGPRDVRVTAGTLPLGSPGTAVTLTPAQTAALFTTPLISGSPTIGAAEQSSYGLAISGIPNA